METSIDKKDEVSTNDYRFQVKIFVNDKNLCGCIPTITKDRRHVANMPESATFTHADQLCKALNKMFASEARMYNYFASVEEVDN